MRVKDALVNDLADLEAQLERAYEHRRSLAKAAHMVSNCPSDLQARDMAHRTVQNLQYQIGCIKNDKPIY